MKNDLKILAVALEKKLGKAHVQHDEKHTKTKVLHKVWDILRVRKSLRRRHSTAWHYLPASKVGRISREHCMEPMMG